MSKITQSGVIGTPWFKRFAKEAMRISPHIRIVPVKHGFYRIYWKSAYIHEVYKEMPAKGYDIYDEDPRLESFKYFQEFEDQGELVRKIKNFVEGYWDSIDTIRTRVYMLRHDKEFRDEAFAAYKTMVIK